MSTHDDILRAIGLLKAGCNCMKTCRSGFRALKDRNPGSIKRLRNMESENGVEGLIGNHDVLAPGIHGNSAGIL